MADQESERKGTAEAGLRLGQPGHTDSASRCGCDDEVSLCGYTSADLCDYAQQNRTKQV
jgi:hypothetical protein